VHQNPFRLPSSGLFARLFNGLGNSLFLARIRRFMLSRLPFLTLKSDVVDVVYASWVVPAAAVQDLVPRGVRLTEINGSTVLTVLSYRHGHFGPRFMGRLRRVLPSPLQSNWRLYVEHLPNGSKAERVVLFIRNIFDSALYGVGSRLFSDALPSHVAREFSHEKSANRYHTRIDGGSGSSPSFALSVELSPDKRLPEAFRDFFVRWEDAVSFLTLQESAIAEIPGMAQLAQAGIDLPINTRAVQPAVITGCDPGQFLAAHGVSGEPLCFVVGNIPFTVLWERCI